MCSPRDSIEIPYNWHNMCNTLSHHRLILQSRRLVSAKTYGSGLRSTLSCLYGCFRHIIQPQYNLYFTQFYIHSYMSVYIHCNSDNRDIKYSPLQRCHIGCDIHNQHRRLYNICITGIHFDARFDAGVTYKEIMGTRSTANRVSPFIEARVRA